ncbi:hypothetical protein G6011_08652 [Alternaria panax]|uniref:Uncharacterized protein n=1 Tax=Alternaria panax TaxID=48097 RepID=A0AAD4FMV1_9PLEO|nr:hypothetical protein G6011_08652 [Alternaria panax]
MCETHDGRSSLSDKMLELQQLAEQRLGEYEDEDEENQDLEEELEEESHAPNAHQYDVYGRDPMFDNSEEEEESIACYDSCGTPKDDARRRRIFAKYEIRQGGRG